MRLRRGPAGLALAAALLAGVAVAAIAQGAPESLLPEGFGDPAPPPPVDSGAAPGPRGPADVVPNLALAPPDEPPPEEEAEEPEPFELPAEARRPIDVVGPLGPDQGGLGAAAFAGANGAYLTRLMRNLDAPIASRWASIALRRALLSHVPAPGGGVTPADWVAERAWLLLRMGEADAARMLVQSVDVDRYSPRLYAVAMQTALATADPSGLCPLTAGSPPMEDGPAWPLAAAMCAALAGESAVSSVLLDHARQGARNRRSVDILLAEKVIGAGTNSRRAVNIEWTEVSDLNTWRFGLANAVGVAIPEPLFGTVGPQVRAWQARAPLMTSAARIPSARVAAALGVFSSAALVDLYGAAAADADEYGSDTDAGKLRAAYVADDDESRLEAMRSLWSAAVAGRDRYAAAILTARAASRITPGADHVADANSLVAAMFSAGLDVQAARWARVIEAADAAEVDDAWAMLAVGAPRMVVDTSYGRIDRYGARAGDAGRHKAQLLVAALAGLGRVSAADAQRLAEEYKTPLGASNRWTEALDKAVAGRQAGTVVLLAAVGMQTSDWRNIAPVQLYHIVSALRRVGMSGQARMIAAEAIARS